MQEERDIHTNPQRIICTGILALEQEGLLVNDTEPFRQDATDTPAYAEAVTGRRQESAA